MNVLKNLSLFRNEYIYFAILCLLMILSLEKGFFFIVLIVYLYYLWKTSPQTLKVGLVICLLFALRVELVQHQPLDSSNIHTVKVTSLKEYDQFTSFRGKVNHKSYQFQYSGNHQFSIGEVYEVSIEELEDNNGDIPYTFDLKKYDKALKINGRYKVLELTKIKNTVHINQLIMLVEEYMQNSIPQSYGYVKTMILAENEEIDKSVLEAINDAGISHLFAVSGLHIGLLVVMLRKGLGYLFKKDYLSDIALAIFLLFYMFLTSFSPSVVRASMMVMFILINRYKKLQLDTLDIVSLVFIVLLFVHPYYYLQLGFQLSFLMTFFIVLARPLLSYDDKIKSAFALSMIAFFASLPFVVSLNQSVNVLTVFYNVIYLFFVMFLLLPLAYITFVFPIFDDLYSILITVFEYSVLWIEKIDIFKIDFVMNKLSYIVIYYILCIGLLIQIEEKHVRRSWVYVSSAFSLFILFQGKFVVYSSVHFLDVYGDATVIQSSFDRCNILIDTGVSDPYDGLITYMKNKHIKRLDYVIISHHHDDHHGELEDVFKSFDVINYIDQSNVDKYQDVTRCGDQQFFFYPLTEGHHNENNNSLVMSMYVGDDHYLFTGDMETSREKEFIALYDVKDVDKLKVAHHGSITSSSDAFIDMVSPKEAYVMVALKNTHNHPSVDVMNRYQSREIDVYRTDQLGTIEIRYLFGKEWKKTSKR